MPDGRDEDMRAVWLREYGGPEVLHVEETEAPVPGPGQVLVDVVYANITFVDTQIRAGKAPFPVRVPRVLGNGVGGVVSALGPHTDRALLGRRVVGGTGGSGGYAEQAVVAVEDLHVVPDALGLAEATALLADGRTASLLIAAAGIEPGDTVLVEAAAGGVGTLLVQMALARGAVVVAAAGGPDKLALAGELGAQHLVDYRDPAWAAGFAEAVGGVDVVFDGVGGAVGRAAFGLLARGGRMLSFGLASGEWTGVDREEAERRGIAVIRAEAGPDALHARVAATLAEAAAGRLHPVIGRTVPLADAADAHGALQNRRTIGKTLLATDRAVRDPGSEV